mgnify:CR=1 FL=1
MVSSAWRLVPTTRTLPPSADICYATQNRQDAVKKICEQATIVLVVGSQTSSNANRLVEVASVAVEAARMLDPYREIDLEAPTPVEVEGDRERLRQPAGRHAGLSPLRLLEQDPLQIVLDGRGRHRREGYPRPFLSAGPGS